MVEFYIGLYIFIFGDKVSSLSFSIQVVYCHQKLKGVLAHPRSIKGDLKIFIFNNFPLSKSVKNRIRNFFA